MKKLFKVALVALCMVFMGNFAKAQSKIGHIAFDQVVQQLPELKTVQTQIQAVTKQWQDVLTAINTELATKSQDFDAKRATMTDAVRTVKTSELQDLQKRLQDQNQAAQNDVETKSNQLIKPLTDKVRAAVAAVAKEKGYAYVLNSTQTDLIVAPEADDLLVAVKAKLGIK